MARPGVSRSMPYGVAIASVAVALLLELIFTHFHLPHAFAAFALSAIAITFWYGGTKPGIVAVLLTIMIRSYLFETEISTVSRVLYDLVFVIFAVLMSWLKRRRSELEEKVAERTAELTDTNEELKKEIVERKKADEKLRRSEAYLLEGQRLVHMFSWARDAATGKVTCSPEVRRIFGAAAGEDVSTTEFFLGRIHPEDRPGAERDFAAAALSKVSYESDYRIILPDGSVKNIHTIGHPVLNDSGEIVEYVGTAMDMTEQRRASSELETAFEEIKKLKDQLHDENVALREQIDQAFMFEEIVGSSPALRTVLSNILKVAPTDSTVLITGETGTGKELIARAIHKRSQRSSRAFVAVNCASIPSSLIASELFGYEKGAFTGALQRHQGRFELAHSGTIFLDEVGELPPETQIALLRVLQEHQFERVGGTRVLPTDVRVIAATNRDLRVAIASGTFRADLFYRLNVFPIEVPPLRQRKEDIPMLVEYFVKRYAEKAGKQIYKVDKNTMDRCQTYPWPGNIRELQNIIERSVILCSGDTLWIDDAWLASEEQSSRPELSAPLTETLQHQEREIIEAALAASGGRVAGPNGAAAKLGIPRSTLDSKIKQLSIRKHKFAPEPQ
jgi:transcriptional regulator with PAS, ATPase and Fis domain